MGAIMKHPTPPPPRLGTADGLAYALFMPDEEPRAGVVVLHGAGSAKESHFDFGRAARQFGVAALVYDARGHGRSEGEFGPTALGDALAMGDLLAPHVPAVCLRGSSLGGFCALHAAALEPAIAAVVAISPAPEGMLLRGIRSGEIRDFRADERALEPWLESLSLTHAVETMPAQTALLLLHAQGDEQVPYTVSEELHRASGAEHKRLLVLPGGHHRSLQHDGEMQGESLRFMVAAVGRRGSGGAPL